MGPADLHGKVEATSRLRGGTDLRRARSRWARKLAKVIRLYAGKPAAHAIRRVALCHDRLQPRGTRQEPGRSLHARGLVREKRVNAIAYLTDVLTRIQSHPASRVEELLPHRWKPPNDAART
jgi:hypothetical protein